MPQYKLLILGVLLALAVVAIAYSSNQNNGLVIGDAIQVSTPGKQDPVKICTAVIDCSVKVQATSDQKPTSDAATSAALAACNTNAQAAVEACNANLSADSAACLNEGCTATISPATVAATACTISGCSQLTISYNYETAYTTLTTCRYTVDASGNLVKGPCTSELTHNGSENYTGGWTCTATDGTATGSGTCKP